MCFKGVFGLCIAIKMQWMVKRVLSSQQTCSLQDVFVVCSKEKFCKLQGFLFPWKVCVWLPLTFMGIACLLKGKQSPNIYGLMLKFFCTLKCGIIGTRGSHIVYRHSQSDYIPKENTTKFEPFIKEYAVVFLFGFQLHLRASVVYYRDIFVNHNKTTRQGALLEKVGVPKLCLHFGHYGSEAVLYLFTRCSKGCYYLPY